ncbi:unnamed protein product, partial [Phaeothamnion confervicola]
CSAVLFNLSNEQAIQNDMVSKGAAFLAHSLWKRGNGEIRRQCALSLCALSTGERNVNTAKAVRHGAGVVLVHFALRLVPSSCLAANGVIEAAVALAAVPDWQTRHNCAIALRSMTCRADIRQLLVGSGAVDVILKDSSGSNDGDGSGSGGNSGSGSGSGGGIFGRALLCEIEAESWINGTRGVVIEARAPPLPPLPLSIGYAVAAAAAATAAAATAAAAAALPVMGADGLYGAPWGKSFADDVVLEEPEM